MRIYAKVISRSSKNEVTEVAKNEYKIKVTAPPVDGEANQMVIKILSKHFDVSKSSVNIIGGKSAKIKIIDILE
ncbi:MAG TPA: hypothetical protein DDY52_03810 [Candidatus Moranbacteria bacterium]|nr:MAG: hypothetical protein UR51_C0008G0063 [Candidatus Moranbacteria bacterium GW2011_GWF1_34_10]HBI17240.1 hypothetical protein [Candidatus Moranbacteria bacterium]